VINPFEDQIENKIEESLESLDFFKVTNKGRINRNEGKSVQDQM
jgi:hypothetical protein